MKKMELRDMRTERDFWDDKMLLRRSQFKSIFEYYKGFASPANACLILLTLASIVFFLFMREVSKFSYDSTTVSCLYLTAYSTLIITPAITVLQIASTGFKPFVYRYYKTTSLLKELLKTKSYAEMLAVFAEYDPADLCVLRNETAVNTIRIWCSENNFANLVGDATIKRVQTNETNVKVFFNEDDFAVLPFARKVNGKEPALILTDAGVILQLAA